MGGQKELIKGYRKGKVSRVEKCCREIRISIPHTLGKIYEGFNTFTGEQEFWMCIKEEKDPNKNIMQRIFYE